MTPWERRAPDWYTKQGDTSPAVAFQLLDGNGDVVPLAGASVKFMMYAPGAASPKVNAAATITDAPTGKVAYTLSGTDSDTPGDYLAEWQVTFAGGAIETFPNGTALKVRVLDDIAV